MTAKENENQIDLDEVASFLPGNLESVLFDLDGTLIDTVPVLEEAYFRFLAAFDRTGTKEEFQEFAGPPLTHTVSVLKERHTLEANFEQLYEIYLRILGEKYVFAPEAAGAEALLGQLFDAGIGLALVTSAPRELVQDQLKHRNWGRYFNFVITSDDVAKTKPDPLPYIRAITQLGVEKSKAIAVEDSVNGVRSANAAGVTVIALALDDNQRPALKSAGAAIVVRPSRFFRSRQWR